MAFLIFCIGCFQLAGSPQIPVRQWELRGLVRDAATGETIPAANIRLQGSSRGTIANSAGRFILPLEEGSCSVIVSSIGYRPDTLHFQVRGNVTAEVALDPVEIVMPEVVVTSEDPAIEIIRRAIANKRKWIERLNTYQIEAFTRQTIRRDTAIAAIAESYTRGYWQKGDTLREVVTRKRQTENVREAENFAAVGRILNFNEERVRFVGFSFVGPTADDALDYYDYRLLRTHTADGGSVYEIRMIPRSRTVPLFFGTVSIADGSYALVGVDVEPNEAFVLPFVSEKRLRYRQQFSLYDTYYWLPTDIRVDANFTVSILGFSIPSIGIEQTSVIYNYEINTPLPDSVFLKPRLTVDSAAARPDSSFWASARILPLDQEQERAYATLDSTQRLDVQFRPSGAMMTLGSGGEAVSFLQYLDAGFNRVEGFRLGVRADVARVAPILGLRGAYSYGFSDKRAKYSVGFSLYTSPARILGFSGDAYRDIDHRPDAGSYGPLFNSMTSLLVKNDYRDYFGREGWRAGVLFSPAHRLGAELAFVSEQHRSVDQVTDYSFFNRNGSYRPNPPVQEGKLRSLVFSLRWGEDPVPLNLILRDALEISVEHTAPSLSGSQFRYTRYEVTGSFSVPTSGEGFLLRPQIAVRVAAGTSAGDLPSQRWFSLESSSSGFGPFGVMRGMRVKEFSGVGYVAVNLEQNFRSIPFLALGIPFVYEGGIEFLIHGGAARSWDRGGNTLTSTDGWYTEAGFGVGRILDFLRVDFTWRISNPSNVLVTVAVSSLF